MSAPATTDSVRLIESVAKHLHVFPDMTGFEWFGVQRITTSAAYVAASDNRKCLVDAVAGCLYENFYCTGRATAYAERYPHESTRHSQFVQSVLNANSTRIAFSKMKVLRVTPSEVVTSCGGVAIHTDRASTLLKIRKDRRPLLADGTNFPSVVKVGARSWTLGASPGFILMIGRRDPHVEPGALHRVYWNLSPDGTAEFVAAATNYLNHLRVPFRLKVLAEPRLYSSRLDTAIVYLNLRTTNAREALAETYCEISHYLRAGATALTYQIATGLAVAEDTGGGMSFGMHRCRLIAKAIVEAAERGVSAPEDVLAHVESVFAGIGISLLRPHQREGAHDGYIGEFALAVRQTPSRKPAQTGLIPEAPDVSWLTIASTIGRQLAAEAFWSKGRCHWMGRERSRSGYPVFRTLSANLYSGVAGIGHFLAELASRTHSGELAATALGAVRQAVAMCSSEGPIGLYDGLLGTAVIAIRAARVLGDSTLADQAAVLARRFAAQSQEQGPDLLNGLAGQIMGFLILADLVPDQLFKSRAVEIGQLLVQKAEHAPVGCSWPNRMVESTSNLTGLSHGGAGIALALGELWRSTGEGAFLAAATEAIAYEDAAFSEKHSNWPDYRLSISGTKSIKYTNFWCHGAPGIVLSRLRLIRLFGLGLPPHLPVAVEAFRQAVEANLHRRDTNFSLCHGVAGNAEVLWECSRWGDVSADWQQRAAETANKCWRAGATLHASSQTWPCGDVVDNPSLFLGRAGIGYAYLRLHDCSVPSVLAIDPAIW